MTSFLRRPTAFTRVVLAVLLCALLAAGCKNSTTSDSQADGSQASQEEAGAQPQPREGSDEQGAEEDDLGGDEEPRLVPPLVLPAGAPGTDEAAEALLAELDRFITDEQREAGVPWPDLRNPDPVAVYRTDAAFQQWMSENNPTPSLVEAYTAPASPERGWDLEMFDFLNTLDLRAGPSDPPYSMRVEDLVHPAATGITDTLLADVPEGSAAIVYWDSVGASDTFTAEGQYWSSDPGWVDVGPWVAIMAPTDVGWRVWWDELTEPPPPGSRQNQGAPQEDPSRRDL